MPSNAQNFDIGPRKRIRNLRSNTFAEQQREWYLSSQVLRDKYSELINPNAKLIVRQAPPKKSRFVIVPFVAGAMAIVLLLQTVIYATSAKNAQGEILGAATSAYSDLSSAGSDLANQNFSNAENQFTSALNNLQDAQQKLGEFKALQLIAPQAKGADHVLNGAAFLAQAGQKLSSALSLFDHFKISDQGIVTADITPQIQNSKNTLNESLNLLKQSQSEFDAATGLPDSYSSTLDTAKLQVNLLVGTLENLNNLENIYLGLFGQGPKTYLLVFQNYDEARATGGFIGTYGTLKIDAGKIQSLKIDSIYDLDGHIYDQIAAPGPFQPEIKKWGIRDANWFVDFPTTAKKLLYFYELGGETADGVLAITPNLFQDLLKLTGPIPMPAYNVTLTSDNFQKMVQYKTSVDYDKTLNQPKKFLADFAPILLNKLSSLDRQQLLQMLQIMQNNLNQKQILLYSKDPNVEENIQELKFAGQILPSDQDYINIVSTNLGGTKTDLEVKQSASLKTKILSDGTIIDTLTLTRRNTATDFNKGFIRVLVPEGSSLLSSQGFDAGAQNKSEAEGFKTDPDLALWDMGQMVGDRTMVRTEAGKTEFTGWLITNPGESKTVTLVYTIPYKASISLFKNNVPYSLLFQKQDGIKAYDFKAFLDTENLKPYWLSNDASFDSGSINFNYTTGSDQYWATLLTK